MTILSANNTPRVSYTASSNQTAFTVPFEFFNITDLKVYKNTALMTFNSSATTNTLELLLLLRLLLLRSLIVTLIISLILLH